MLNKKDLEVMSGFDITALDPSRLVDITEVKIDPGAPDADRLDDFLKQIENPYCYRVNNTPVKIRFGQGKPYLDQVLEDYFTQNK